MPDATPTADLSQIRGLVARARSRLRLQAAIEAGTTALVVASVAALAVIFCWRTERVTAGTGALLLAACGLGVIGAALIAALRRLDDERVARQIDRASGLADRLSSAIAFERVLGQAEPDTREFMEAAMRDAVRAAPRADVIAATRFHAPRDARAAGGFLLGSALLAGLAIPMPDRDPALTGTSPTFAPPGTVIRLEGRNLLRGVGDGTPSAQAVPANVSVFLGDGDRSLPMSILAWSVGEARIEIPATAPFGETTIVAFLGGRKVGPVPFTVVDPKDERFHREEAVALTDEDLDYAKDLLEQLRATARDDEAQDLDAFVAKVEQLLEQAERGELTKEQLLAALQDAEAELNKGAEPNETEIDKQLAETGKELQQNELTKELGAALAKGDLEKAKDELEKLAEQLAKNELTPKQEEQLQKAMDKAAKQFEQKQEQEAKAQKERREKMEEEIRRLEKEKQDAKTPEEQADAERRLDKKKDELQRLSREQQQKEQSAQREAVKRLHRDMQKAAESLEKPKQGDKQEQTEQERQEQRQQASRSLKDAAEETGKVERDQRKTAAQKKVATQMEDLKEAMRRAKQKGGNGGKDPFGKQGKQKDFNARARGGQGKGTAWKPGQGQGQGGKGQGGKGDGQDGGEAGDPQAGKNWGTGTAELTGDATDKGGNTSDQDVSGVQGKGPSKRETILSAAQKGFASRGYQKVYVEYRKQVEEVMRAEKVPSAYRNYVGKYFTKIKPHTMD